METRCATNSLKSSRSTTRCLRPARRVAATAARCMARTACAWSSSRSRRRTSPPRRMRVTSGRWTCPSDIIMNKITIEELNSRVLYNHETGYFMWLHCDAYQKRWNSRFVGKKALNAPHSNGYLFGAIANCKIFAHRAAWAMFYGQWPDDEIDHINHDKTNNKISNLRMACRSQNSKNLSKSKRNISGVTGVFKHTQTGKWNAQIRVCKKSIHLGSFDVFQNAVLARQKAEEKYGFHKNHGI